MEVKKKKIWLVNQYAMPPEFESRIRTIKFAQYLTESGFDVTIFASSVMHNMNIDLITDGSSYIEKNYGIIKFVHLKTIKHQGNGFSRFIGLLEFPLKLYFLRNKFEKPDIILQTATVPFGNILYYCAKKLKSKYVVEVLDLWPESFVDLGLISKRNPLVKFSYIAEKWLYKKADALIFSMEGGKNYIKDKKWDIQNGGPIDLNKVFYINNGVDIRDFNFNVANYQLDDIDLENDSIKRVVYIGSIRLANNIKELIGAAEELKKYSDIKFLIYGNGDYREILENYCIEKNLNNVIFKEKWIDPHYVPYLLSRSTINILNYKSGGFGKYGGSQSKLFQYLASGKPICSNLKMMYGPINKYDLGIAKEFKSNKEYADAILYLVNLDDKRTSEINVKAVNVANNFDYIGLTKNLISIFKVID